MIGIVVSEADIASREIGDALLERGDWSTHECETLPREEGGGTVHRWAHFELRTYAGLHLELEDVASAFEDPSAILFVARHAGETGPLLSTHFPGNVGDARFGGTARELPAAAPELLAELYAALRASAPERYEVGIECTHHGPSRVGAPSLFAELGSGPTEWEDPAGAAAIAEAVCSLSPPVESDRTVVGFGGSHYAPRFARLLRETGWRVGHIAADWSLAELTDADRRRAVVSALFDRSDASVALIEGEHPRLREEIRGLGHRAVSETWLREADGISLDVVGAAEAHLGPIDEGTRLGAVVELDPDGLYRTALPAEFLAEVQGIDRAAAIAAVSERAVAYATTEGGNRLAGSMLLPDEATLSAVIDACVRILRERYDAVERSGGAVTVTETTFDPAAARSLGVPEGPAFGRLASGEAVEVDDRVIDPEAVTRTTTRRIPVTPN